MNAVPENWTIRTLLKWTTDFFRQKKISSARLDAELLLAHALGVSRLQLYLDPDRPVSQAERRKFRGYVRMRARRKPVAYILGYKEFWSKSVEVTEDVLIPRPETENMVEYVVECLEGKSSARILDLGTGSGCIALALADALPDALFWCVDRSPGALAVAERNFAKNNLSHRAVFLPGDWFGALANQDLENTFHVIVSNPPYIPSPEFNGKLQPEIVQYEPRIALDGGEKGLDAYPILARGARRFLMPEGFIVVEIGENQSEDVSGFFREAGFRKTKVIADGAGVQRFVAAFSGAVTDIDT